MLIYPSKIAKLLFVNHFIIPHFPVASFFTHYLHYNFI